MTWPSFLSPWVGGIAALIAIPTLVLLYFLKLRRRSMEVSTTLLWKKSIEDLQANAPFQKLRKNILLLLQLIALAMILFALAQPVLDSAAPPPPRSIIMIDTSASMGADDEQNADGDPQTRIARAKREAIAFVESMSSGAGTGALGAIFGSAGADEAMVIAFDNGAQVVQPFTPSKPLLIAAIESLEARQSSTRLEPAAKTAEPFAAARTVTGENDTATTVAGVPIVLWSDGGLADAESAQLPSGIVIDYRRVGSDDAPNLAIISMQAQRVFDRQDEIEVFVAIQSTDDEPREADVEFSIDGIASRARRVSLPPRNDDGTPGTGGVVFKLTRSEAAVLSASLVIPSGEPDALGADNVAWATLAPARRMTVAMVGAPGVFVRKALESMPLASLDQLTPVEFAQALSSNAREHEVYVVSQWPDASLLPEGPLVGRFLSLGAVPPGDAITVERAGGDGVSAMVRWNRNHPALRYVDLDPTRILGAPLLSAGERANIIGTGSEGPLLFEIDSAGTRAIVVGFDTAKSTWPSEWSFPLFIAQSVRYLGDDLAELASPVARPGEVVRTTVPIGVTAIRHTTPDGGRDTLRPAPDGSVVVGPIEETGVHTLSWDGPPGAQDTVINDRAVRLIAASMQDPIESRLESMETIDLSSVQVRASSRADDSDDDGATPLWPLLVLLGLVMVMVEWYVYNRKVRI
ncbi:MAG: BatA and WFA domain-containing protein [Planctomycetota bacterium]